MDNPALRRFAPKIAKPKQVLTQQTLDAQTKAFLKCGGKVQKVPVIIHAKEYDGRQETVKKTKAKRQWAKLRGDVA